MASGEEEVAIIESGTTRTRSTRAVTARKAARGRKKAAVSSRTTRAKRSRRSTQPESEEEEDEVEAQNESNQDASESIAVESLEESVTEDDHVSEDNMANEDNIPEEKSIREEDKTEDGNKSDIGEDIQEEEGRRNESKPNKPSEETEKDSGKQNSECLDDKIKTESQEATEHKTCENGHDKAESDDQEKVKVKQETVKDIRSNLKKADTEDTVKASEETEVEETDVNIKRENGGESDSNETTEIKQEAKLVKQELEELNQLEMSTVPEQVKTEQHASPKPTAEEKQEPECMEVNSESKTEEKMEVDEDISEVTEVKVEVKQEPSSQKKTKEKKVKVKEQALEIVNETEESTVVKTDVNEIKEEITVEKEDKAAVNETEVSVTEKEDKTVVNKMEVSVTEKEDETVESSVDKDKAAVSETEDSSVEKEVRDEEDVENMTVIDEITDESAVQEQQDKEDKTNVEGQSPFPTEPDTEMVSEDELPTESSKEPLETEAVSDEELPEPAAPVDLPETEAVSEDELPPEKVEKKKKKKVAAASKVTGSGAGAEGEVSKKKVRSTESQKRKLIDGDTYDPSSPTSENSCDETPSAKRAAISSATGIQAKPVTKTRKALPELEKYWKAVKEDPSDFTGWTYLLQYVDQENDIEAAREAYDAFLSHYPYCYGYWRKYADYEKRKGNKEKCEEVFERGLKAIPLSVDLWIHFLNYSKATYSDDEDHLRSQFEKAIGACGMEFRSDRLWESYIKWETEGKRLQNVTSLYDRLLAMPTQGYTNHFDNFQEHIASNPPQKVLTVDEFLTLRREVLQQLKQYDTPTTADDAVPGEEVEAPPGEEPEEQPAVKSDEETTALRERIISIRRKLHKTTVSAVADRWNYEEGIKRPYFHVKPLERCQLKNWKEYLDYEIEQGDKERIIVLFERCLIACALYEEFWIKFVRYLESIKGEDVNDKIRNVYERACTIHHTKKPNLHLHWAVFEESHKNYDKASEILNNLEKLIPNMLQVAYRRINLERRRNNMEKVCTLYEHYISNTKNKVISNNMAIKYARFCWKVKGDVERAIAILNKAIDKDKDNPRLYLQLIDMGLQKCPLKEEEIVSIIDLFLTRDTDPEQKVLFAQRKVEFLEDFGSDIVSVQKAHDEFQRYFKQAKDRKKKSPDLDKSATGQQAAQASATAAASTSQYQATTYNQTGAYSQQTQAQGSYQGSQYAAAGPQQPPTPYNQPPYNQQYGQSSDPNYANYQNWGYSQTGYGGYNQGWGNYNYY